MKLALFSTVESNILTDKSVIQIAKRIRCTTKLKLSLNFLKLKFLHHNCKCLIFKTKD